MSKVKNSLDNNKIIDYFSDESMSEDISLSNYASEDDEPIEIHIKIENNKQEVNKQEVNKQEVIKMENIKQSFILAKNKIAELQESDSSDDINSINKEIEIKIKQYKNI